MVATVNLRLSDSSITLWIRRMRMSGKFMMNLWHHVEVTAAILAAP